MSKRLEEYSVKEAAAVLGVTVSWVLHKKNGRRNSAKKRGKMYSYNQSPAMIEGKHWEWRKGRIIIFSEGLELLRAIQSATLAGTTAPAP
jgi:hypothetical protein